MAIKDVDRVRSSVALDAEPNFSSFDVTEKAAAHRTVVDADHYSGNVGKYTGVLRTSSSICGIETSKLFKVKDVSVTLLRNLDRPVKATGRLVQEPQSWSSKNSIANLNRLFYNRLALSCASSPPFVSLHVLSPVSMMVSSIISLLSTSNIEYGSCAEYRII